MFLDNEQNVVCTIKSIVSVYSLKHQNFVIFPEVIPVIRIKGLFIQF